MRLKFAITLVNHNDRQESRVLETTQDFQTEDVGSGWNNFIIWTELSDASRGFCVGDAITLVVNMTPLLLTQLWWWVRSHRRDCVPTERF